MKLSHLLSIGVVIIAGGILYFVFSDSFSSENKGLLNLQTQEDQFIPPTMEQPNGLRIEEIVVGTGTEAKTGSTVSVHYTGTLADGKKFDSSLDRGEPFSFTIGQRSVIEGWEQGIPGMKVGGKRKLTISPALAYGDRAVGSIPANSTLVFEVELLWVQ
ncbi:MAG: FKBP-type peptidyl-prolyl cis-trans isomerase [Parcubacteria group bacterium]|nr:FKBP-type peptidyl-prolyl cis-trans isomerase [Parcubacteria group bacterium]